MAAARALMSVEHGAHVDDVLAVEAPPEGSDRGLAWFLALGVLRRRGTVDAALRPFLRQPLGSLDPEVRAVLRIGAFEKLYARTRPHAAVHQAVEVARTLGASKASGLVNAVMRRARIPGDVLRHDRLEHPPWLVSRWDARYGEDAVDRWLSRSVEPSPLFLVARAGADELSDELRTAGVNASPARFRGDSLDGVLRIEGHHGPISELPGYDEGRFWVQDVASVWVAELLGAQPGMRVLDACAAPGGKAFRMASRGARVTALDLSETRLERLIASGDRLGFELAPRCHDWERGPSGEDLFDAVLVDAPCSALGLTRRHPEIRWRRQLVDVLACATRQQVILRHASLQVRPGGILVYAVCSPEPDEGDEVVRGFLNEHPGFRLEHSWSTVPPEGDEDGFYVARLVREP